MNKLSWNVSYGSEYEELKQRAWDAAVAAVRKVREEASYPEMQTAAVQAVQPMIREYEHEQACQRIVRRVYIYDATREEEEAAKEAVRKALAALPIGAEAKQLEKTGATALALHQAAVAKRRERDRVAWKADYYLSHIERYLEKEYEFDGGYREMRRDADRLRPVIREALIDELVKNPDMSAEEIRGSIEDQIDAEFDDTH
jgi:hypothetical protein